MALNFSKMNFSVSFNPTAAFPLDSRSYFESYDKALAAAALAVEAGSSDGTLYYGQSIAVVENGVAQMFQIQPDGTLGEIGGKIEIDEKQFVIDEETGKLNLYGFADAVAGAQLVIEEVDGVKALKWVKPDTTTVDGLATKITQLEAADNSIRANISALEGIVGKDGEEPTGLFKEIDEVEGLIDLVEADVEGLKGDVEGLEGTVGALENLVGAPKEGEAEATGLFAEVEGLDTRIDALEAKDLSIEAALNGKANVADVYTKNEVYTKDEVYTKTEVYTVSETDDAIAIAVAGAAHLKRIKVANVDAIDLGAADAEQYIYMVPAAEGDAAQGDLYDEYMVLEGKLERVGDWKVDLSEYATVSSVSGISAQVNGISAQLPSFAKSADVEEALAGKVDNATLEGYATTGALANEVAKLATKGELESINAALEGKVGIEAGKSLVDDKEIAKLANIAAGAEVNFVKSVDEEQLKVEEGKLSIIELDQALVAGLKNAAGEDATLAAVLAEKAEKTDIAGINAALNGVNAALANKTEKTDVEQQIAALHEELAPKEGERYITSAEGTKLAALTINGDKVEISGTVNASNVQELYDAVARIVTGVGEGTYDGVTRKLLGIKEGAQVNVLEGVMINGVDLAIDAEKKVNIPQATIDALGLVKSSEDENKVKVLADGTMEVNSLNVEKLVQDEAVILNGGNAAGEYTA